MAGAQYRVDIDDLKAQAQFDQADRAMQDMTPLMASIAEYALNANRSRFQSQTAPDGSAWAPLNPVYAAIKRKNRDKILTLNGYLRGSLFPRHSATEAIVGSPMEYAAIHLFGGVIKPRRGRALKIGKRFVSQVKIPARVYLGVSDEDEANIMLDVMDYLSGNIGQ